MGLFGHSKQKDKLIKYLKEKNISSNEKNGKIEIELLFKDKGFSLYPYFVVDDDNDYFSIIINLKKVEKTSIDLFEKINDFNLLSQYFVLKVSNDNVLYLEYNSIFNDNIRDIFDCAINSLFGLSNAIDSI